MGFTKQQIKEIEATLVKALSTQEFVDVLQSVVNEAIKTAMGELGKKVEQVVKDFSRLETENKQMIKDCTTRCVELEQYVRRNNLRLFGVQEVKQENCEIKVLTEVIQGKLGIRLPEYAIERAHRIGKSGNKRRPIVIKFANYKFRNMVFTHKKLLKGTGIVIKEDLCSERLEVLKEATNKFGIEKVWTRDGAIMINLGDRIRRIVNTDELAELEMSTNDDDARGEEN